VTLVRGDSASLSVAAASVVAKVARDAGMVAVAPAHPAYGFARNKGYPSPEHVAALAAHGPCALHRRSWAPLRALAQGQLPGTAV
jgi:ribonuclease HII